MPELAEALIQEHDMRAAPAELSRFLKHRLGYTYKKILDCNGEAAQAGARRAIRVAAPTPAEDATWPHRLVFIDETAVTTKLTRLRGRSPCGARLEADAPFGHWRTQIIAGLRVDGAPWLLDGPMNRLPSKASAR